MAEPVARSPIASTEPTVVVAGWLVSGGRTSAELTVTDLTPLTKVAVRADPDGPMAADLVAGVGQAARLRLGNLADDVLVTCAAPGEWLVLAGPGRQTPVLAWAQERSAGHFASVVDLTHGRALLRLTGRRAAAVLAKESALDLGDRGCPNHRALRTAMAALAVDVVRDDRAGRPSYLLHCERSSGQYLFDVILESGAEFGIGVDGFPDLQAPTS